MEKKKYIAPTAEVMDMEVVEIIATSIPIVGGEGEEQLSNSYRPERRGVWGDLWATDTEK